MSYLYGSGVIVVLFASMLSRCATYQKLALVLMLSWSLSNLFVEAFGFVGAPLLMPGLDAVLCIISVAILVRTQSPTAAIVVAGFMLAGMVHVWAFATAAQVTRGYYVAMNLLFILQLLSVGGASVTRARRAWLDSGHSLFAVAGSRNLDRLP